MLRVYILNQRLSVRTLFSGRSQAQSASLAADHRPFLQTLSALILWTATAHCLLSRPAAGTTNNLVWWAVVDFLAELPQAGFPCSGEVYLASSSLRLNTTHDTNDAIGSRFRYVRSLSIRRVGSLGCAVHRSVRGGLRCPGPQLFDDTAERFGGRER